MTYARSKFAHEALVADAFEKFTEDCRNALSEAQREARAHGHDVVASEHMLLGLVSQRSTVALEVLRGLGAKPRAIRSAVEFGIRAPELSTETAGLNPAIGAGTKEVLRLTVEEARRRGESYIDTEHLLLGLTLAEEGLAQGVLMSQGVTHQRVEYYLTAAR